MQSATYELAAGKSDHLLRRLTMHVDFAFGVPKGFRSALGDLVGADVRFALSIDRPNEQIDVPTG